MQKIKHFKIFWDYIKDDKFKLFLYVMLVALSYLPALVAVYFWGVAVEALTSKDFNQFALYLTVYEGIYILLYTFLQIPRDYLYTYFEIKFTKSVSKNLYRKMDKLPAIAFEDIGVGDSQDHIAVQHGDQGGQNLHHKFQLGGQGVDIVQNTQHHDDAGSQQHTTQRLVQRQEYQDAENEAEKDGQTAHTGDGVVVHPAVVLGHVHGAHLEGQGLDHGGGNQGHNGRGQQSRRGGAHDRKLNGHIEPLL